MAHPACQTPHKWPARHRTSSLSEVAYPGCQTWHTRPVRDGASSLSEMVHPACQTWHNQPVRPCNPSLLEMVHPWGSNKYHTASNVKQHTPGKHGTSRSRSKSDSWPLCSTPSKCQTPILHCSPVRTCKVTMLLRFLLLWLFNDHTVSHILTWVWCRCGVFLQLTFSYPGHGHQDLHCPCNGMHAYADWVSVYALCWRSVGLPPMQLCRDQINDVPADLVPFHRQWGQQCLKLE